MRRYSRRYWMTSLVTLALFAGCSTRHQSYEVPYPVSTRQAFHGPELPIVPGGDLELRPDRLPRFDLPPLPTDEHQPDSLVSGVPPNFRGLGERDVQCRAVASSVVGNFLDEINAEQEPPRSRLIHHKKEEASRRRQALEQEIRHLLAVEARNQDSAIALELFFSLAQAEVAGNLLRDTGAELTTLRGRIDKIKNSGLELPGGVVSEDLARRAITIEETVVEADLAVSVINSKLANQIDVELAHGERFWPTRTWHIPLEPVDVNQATQFAMENRAELRLLRVLIRELDVETLEVFYDAVGSFASLLGGSPGFSKVAECIPLVRSHVLAAREEDAEKRREQLRSLLHSRERAITQEIRQSVDTLIARAKLVALARATVESYAAQLERIQKSVAEGVASSIEESNLNLRLIKARSDLFSAVTAWENARVKLKLAQGAFVPECGGR